MTAIEIGLRASVVVLAALAAAAMLHRRSAALRHWVLAAGILSAAAVAPLGVALPAWDLPLSSSAAESPDWLGADVNRGTRGRAPTAGPAVAAAPSSPRSAAPSSTGVGAGAASAHRHAGEPAPPRPADGYAQPADRGPLAGRRPTLAAEVSTSTTGRAETTGLSTTLDTWGWRRPAVLLPAGCEAWSDERIRSVLVANWRTSARHWAVQMATDVVRAVFG